MAEESDVMIRILREIQKDIGGIKGDIALIKDKLVQHSLQLASQGGSLSEIASILSYLPDWARQSPTDVSRELRAIKERLEALEHARQ